MEQHSKEEGSEKQVGQLDGTEDGDDRGKEPEGEDAVESEELEMRRERGGKRCTRPSNPQVSSLLCADSNYLERWG